MSTWSLPKAPQRSSEPKSPAGLAWLTADETVMLVEGEDFVLVKRPPSAVPADRFEVLAERTQRRFEEEGVSGDDVERAIRWARDSS